MRFPDFLRAAVVLFAAAATALAVVAIAGARAKDDMTIVYVALGWWTVAGLAGLWLGRRAAATQGIERLLSSARTTPLLPELEPGTILFNRLWGLAVFSVGAGGVAFLIPQVPAIGTGYALLVALYWRRQSAAVIAMEQRDGVRFYIDRTSPFKPTRLLRTPGWRRNEPAVKDVVG